MRKVLILLSFVMMTIMSSYSQVDTAFYAPGEVGNYELVVDTVKYPFLSGEEVQWYVGFDSELALGTDYVARKVLDSEIVTVDGKMYLHNEKLGESWDPGTPSIRTLNLYYGFKIVSKASQSDQIYFTRDEMESLTKDTVAVLHLLKDFTKVTDPLDLVSSFRVNGLDNNLIEITEGDTTKFRINPVNDLDIQNYMLINGDQEVIAESDSGYIELIPTESIDELYLVVSNKTGDFTFLDWMKSIEVHPKFSVTEVKYSITNPDKTSTVTETSSEKSVEVLVSELDSVSMTVSTNSEDVLGSPKVEYSWNKDGKDIPSLIKVNSGKLIIPEFTNELTGTYNCIMKCGDYTDIASFNLSLKNATGNELISNKVYVTGGQSTINVYNSEGDNVTVYDMLGKLVYNKVSESSKITIDTKLSGVYVVNVGKNSFKVKVK